MIIKTRTFAYFGILIILGLSIYSFYKNNENLTEKTNLSYIGLITKITPNKVWEWNTMKSYISSNCQLNKSSEAISQENTSKLLAVILSDDNNNFKLATASLTSPFESTTERERTCIIFIKNNGEYNNVYYMSKKNKVTQVKTTSDVYFEVEGIKRKTTVL